MHEVQRVRSATIKDVAARAGVSLKTVSRVVNNEPSVRPRTRDKVQREIDALGYQPDPFARSLRSTRTYALGLVYDNPNAHYIINLQRGALSVCRASGFGLQIHPCMRPRRRWPTNCANWYAARVWPG
jgi:LacI family transcriptional regulator